MTEPAKQIWEVNVVGLIKKCKMFLLLILLFLIGHGSALGSWSGPSTVVQAGWGTGETQFGYSKGEIKDSYPDEFHVLSDGKIAIYDINGKLKVFNKNGVFVKAIEGLGYGLFELNINTVIAAKLGQEKANNYRDSVGVYDLLSEKWLWVDRERWFSYTPELLVHVAVDGSYFVVWTGAAGYKYSASGALLETYTTKPLIFGQEVSSDKISDGNYSTVVKFDDITYRCKTPARFDLLTRDKGFLYGITQVASETKISHNRLYKITRCGKVIATIDFPPDKSHFIVIHDPPPATDIVTVDEEYGQPVIATNGDVYAWKRTPDKYSILKWTWVDDPNVPTGPDAPTGLTLMPSISGLYLTWAASPNDPGCVTGYEVARATSSGGAYSTVATVNASIVKYNDTTAEVGTKYYYKVRAKAGSEYSPYTIKVSGKR